MDDGSSRGHGWSAANGAAPTQRVLVIDDDEDAAAMLAEALTLMGFASAFALDGPAGLREAVRLRPDAVLVDIGLPGMDGYEVARRLRATSGLEHVQLIAVTGYGLDSDRELSRAAGFDHHLVKPVELTAVCSLLQRAA